MRLDEFLARLPSLYAVFPTSQPKLIQRGRTREVLAKVESFTSEAVSQLLGLAVACLEGDEIYCEVGAWNGGSLISALINGTAEAVAVDNFSQFGGQEDRLLGNLKTFGVQDRVRLVNADAKEIFAPGRSVDFGRPVGVFFYDGGHEYGETLDALRGASTVMTENALIVVDDYNWEAPRAAVRDFLAAENGARLHHELFTPGRKNGDIGSWWNGLAVIGWRRNPI